MSLPRVSPMPLARAIAAFVVAPVMTPVTYFFGDWALSGIRPDPWECIMTLIFAYPAELLFGLPLWVVFQRRQITTFAWYTLSGAAIGTAVVVILQQHGLYIAISLVAASLSAVLFRCIVISN